MAADVEREVDAERYIQAFPAAGTYGEQLNWHLKIRGTRPDGTTLTWAYNEFAEVIYRRDWPKKSQNKNITGPPPSLSFLQIGYQANKLGTWISGTACPEPPSESSVEDELFGVNIDLAHWKASLNEAWVKRYKAGKERQKKAGGAKPVIAKAKAPTLLTTPTAASPGRSTRTDPNFVGRTANLEQIVASLLSNEARPAIRVQGGPGIGKTELTRAVANDRRIVERFGDRRFFTWLEAAANADAMAQAIILALGSQPNDGLKNALTTLGDNPTLVILDNLETPWEPPAERTQVQTILSELGGHPNISVMASFRGRDYVGGLTWTAHDVEPLRAPYDRDLFCAVAGEQVRDDALLERFLAQLGGIPLAIELVARQVYYGTPLDELWALWLEQGTKLVRNSDFSEDHLSSLYRSIELSLESNRCTFDARRLFGLLGQLPAGIAPVDLAALFGREGVHAAASLVRVGLAFRDQAKRVQMLPPIRDHATLNHPPNAELAEQWSGHFIELAKGIARKAFSSGGDEARLRIVPEIPNVEAALRSASEQPALREKAVAAASEFRSLMTRTGMGAFSTLERLADICERMGDDARMGDILVGLGIIAEERGRLKLGMESLDRAQAAYARLSDTKRATRGKADCLYRKADIYLHSSSLDRASELYDQASALYEAVGHTRGQGDSAYRSADLQWRTGNYTQALKLIPAAKAKFVECGHEVGVACALWLAGRTLADMGNYSEAKAAIAEAQTFTNQIGNPTVGAHCALAAGDIALAENALDVAEDAYRTSMKIYDQLSDVKGPGLCYVGLARVEIKRGNPGKAKELAQEALRLLSRTNIFDWIGRTHEVLAQLSEPPELLEHARAAQSAFQAANLPNEAARMANVYGVRPK